jgi:hypothetical protein
MAKGIRSKSRKAARSEFRNTIGTVSAVVQRKGKLFIVFSFFFSHKILKKCTFRKMQKRKWPSYKVSYKNAYQEEE